MTQRKRVLKYLETCKSETSADAQRELDILRLASRITEQQQIGHLTKKNHRGEKSVL